MKNVYLLIAATFFCMKAGFALDPPPPHPDSILGGWTPFHTEILQAPVAEGTSVPVTIVPNSQLICFDKKMAIKSFANGQIAEQCLYLNSVTGLVGHLAMKRTGGTDLCDIKPDDPKFSFFIYGLKGNTYHYFNRKKESSIKHYVTTGNSQTYLYQPVLPSGSNTATLYKKTETRMYCNDKFKGKAYKFDGSAQTWFIFGRNYPDAMEWETYFGNFGCGYLKTDKGLFIILEMEANGNSFKVTELDETDACFNPAPFGILEDEFYTGRREELDKQHAKLAIEQAKLGSGDCVSERTELYQFKVEELQRQELNLENSQVGNVYQNTQTQQALVNMMDPKIMVQEGIFDTKVKICKKEIALSKNPDSPSTQEKLSCLRGFLGAQQSYLDQMIAKETQFANNPGQQYVEKSKLMMQLMSEGCD